MSQPPDPKPPSSPESQLKLREIFRAAAEKSTGPGKPYFERLRDSFNDCQAAAEAGNLPAFDRAELKFRVAMDDVLLFARTDDETAAILLQVAKDIKKVAEEENGALPKKKTGKNWKF